jgi:hypothetical protein
MICCIVFIIFYKIYTNALLEESSIARTVSNFFVVFLQKNATMRQMKPSVLAVSRVDKKPETYATNNGLFCETFIKTCQ